MNDTKGRGWGGRCLNEEMKMKEGERERGYDIYLSCCGGSLMFEWEERRRKKEEEWLTTKKVKAAKIEVACV